MNKNNDKYDLQAYLTATTLVEMVFKQNEGNETIEDYVAGVTILAMLDLNDDWLAKLQGEISSMESEGVSGDTDIKAELVKRFEAQIKKGYNLTSSKLFSLFTIAYIDYNSAQLPQSVNKVKYQQLLGGEMYVGFLDTVNPHIAQTIEIFIENDKYYEVLNYIASSYRRGLKAVYKAVNKIKFYNSTVASMQSMMVTTNKELLKKLN